MHKIIVFADRKVGLECLHYILDSQYRKSIKLIIVEENSIVHQFLQDNENDSCTYILADNLNKEKLRNIKADYFFLLWWSRILSNDLIQMAKQGVINLHPSFLPYNRGKHPNYWSIREETPYGVTIHMVNSKIDAGDILVQEKIEKSWEDTGETLYYKAQKKIISLFCENFEKILNNKIIPFAQNNYFASFHLGRELETATEIELDNQYTARDLLNRIRAKTFSGYAPAFFYDNGQKYEVTINIKRAHQ